VFAGGAWLDWYVSVVEPAADERRRGVVSAGDHDQRQLFHQVELLQHVRGWRVWWGRVRRCRAGTGDAEFASTAAHPPRRHGVAGADRGVVETLEHVEAGQGICVEVEAGSPVVAMRVAVAGDLVAVQGGGDPNAAAPQPTRNFLDGQVLVHVQLT